MDILCINKVIVSNRIVYELQHKEDDFSHLARLALAISKWLCSFYHVIFLLGIYLFLLYFLGTK